MKIKSTELEAAPSFHMDPVGNVFYYGGGVYRGIREPYADFHHKLLEADFYSDLMDAGLVETWVSDLEVDGYGLVLQHKRIEFESVWSEWCSWMIQDATLLMVRLNLALAKRGLIANDIKPGNVLFDYSRPVWIDFGSIVPLESIDPRNWLRRFWQTSLFPIWLLSKRRHAIARLIYGEIPQRGLQISILRRPFRWFPLRYWRLASQLDQVSIVYVLEQLVEYISKLEIPPRASGWINYRQGGMPPIDAPDGFSIKQRTVFELLGRFPPSRVLDMGCNKGWYAELAQSLGHQVVGFDVDDETICNVYRRVQEGRLSILPLLADFAWPRPEYGLGLGGRNAYERLGCDITLAMALVHHLVFSQHLRFETIAWIISNYTKRTALVDFPPEEGDITVSKWMRPGYEWYTLENFVTAMKRHFPNIALYESEPAPRRLLVCTK
jgi:hypothetical protein